MDISKWTRKEHWVSYNAVNGDVSDVEYISLLARTMRFVIGNAILALIIYLLWI